MTSDSSPENSPLAPAPSGGIRLTVQGLGQVPSFKNNKRAILDRNTSKMRTLTEPKTKRWMNQCIDQFESQLLTCFQIKEGETVGEWRKRLRTALLPLLDDSWKHMLPGAQNVRIVPKGNEGAEITIDPVLNRYE